MLKALIFSVLLLPLSIGPMPDDSMQDVLSAIRKGDAARLSRHMDEVVRITLDGRTHPHSKTQSEVILRNFFRSRTILDLTVVHQSGGTDGEVFVGDLLTRSDRHRMTIILRLRADRMVLSELRLERSWSVSR